MFIYHIVSDADVFDQSRSEYSPKNLKTIGFIHASRKSQLIPTANRRFGDTDQLKVLEIDTKKLLSQIKFESTNNKEEHPHIYGPIQISAIRRVFSIHKINNHFQE